MDARDALRKASLVSAFLLTACTLGTTTPARAQMDRDMMLPGGICYPGCYDANTAGEVEGPVSEIAVPDDGPVRFTVSGEEERWAVIVSPAWFWKASGARLETGDVVAVRGSKSLGADGRLYIIARSITLPGGQPALLLRDDRGLPLWRGNHGRGGMMGNGHRRR